MKNLIQIIYLNIHNILNQSNLEEEKFLTYFYLDIIKKYLNIEKMNLLE